MNPLERKAELVRRGIKVMDVAAMVPCAASNVSSVLSGMVRSRRIEEKIAQLIGKTREEVFGLLPKEIPHDSPKPSAVA
ncbi:hypothetical protein [Gemmatimonas sp.]